MKVEARRHAAEVPEPCPQPLEPDLASALLRLIYRDRIVDARR